MKHMFWDQKWNRKSGTTYWGATCCSFFWWSV